MLRGGLISRRRPEHRTRQIHGRLQDQGVEPSQDGEMAVRGETLADPGRWTDPDDYIRQPVKIGRETQTMREPIAHVLEHLPDRMFEQLTERAPGSGLREGQDLWIGTLG